MAGPLFLMHIFYYYIFLLSRNFGGLLVLVEKTFNKCACGML